jgi:1-acyl-sn-glycerol-3-phosphate acyltransferase
MTTDEEMIPDDPRDRKRYYLGNTLTRSIVTGLLRILLRLFTKFRVRGLDHVPMSGPVILAANHMTEFDVLPIQLVVPRLIFFMGKAELFKNPIVDAVFRRLGAYPVYRGARDEWAIRHSERILEHGQMLGIFPEGKRSMGEGLRAAKTGAARLALATGAPIIPVAISGTHRMFGRFPRRTAITITFGEPIYPEPGETALALTDRMMFSLAKLLPRYLRGVYAQHPAGF